MQLHDDRIIDHLVVVILTGLQCHLVVGRVDDRLRALEILHDLRSDPAGERRLSVCQQPGECSGDIQSDVSDVPGDPRGSFQNPNEFISVFVPNQRLDWVADASTEVLDFGVRDDMAPDRAVDPDIGQTQTSQG